MQKLFSHDLLTNFSFSCLVYMDAYCKRERNVKLSSSQEHLQAKWEKRTLSLLRTSHVPLSPDLSIESYYLEYRPWRTIAPCVSATISSIKRQCHSFSDKLLEIWRAVPVFILSWSRSKIRIKYQKIVKLQNHIGSKALQGGCSLRHFITKDWMKCSRVPDPCLVLLSLNHLLHLAMVPRFSLFLIM